MWIGEKGIGAVAWSRLSFASRGETEVRRGLSLETCDLRLEVATWSVMQVCQLVQGCVLNKKRVETFKSKSKFSWLLCQLPVVVDVVSVVAWELRPAHKMNLLTFRLRIAEITSYGMLAWHVLAHTSLPSHTKYSPSLSVSLSVSLPLSLTQLTWLAKSFGLFICLGETRQEQLVYNLRDSTALLGRS